VDVRKIIAMSACGVLGVASTPASAAPMVTWLGALDDEAGVVSAARGVSPDGGTVVGIAASNTTSGYSAFKWTAADGMVALPSNGEGTATDTTNGGAVIAGYDALMPSDVWGRYWVNGGNGDFIGPAPGGRQGSVFTHGISHDGSIIVGTCVGSTIGQVALRWTSATGPVALPHLSDTDKYSQAYAISGDGSTIVGTSDNGERTVAARWTSSGVSFVGDLPGGHVNGSAAGVSPDGSVIVGSSSSAASGETFHEAFRWTQAGGIQPLGLLDGHQLSHAEDVSANGSVVVGYSSTGGDQYAFIWTPANGMRDLSTYLADAGVDIGTWRFDSAQGVSDDGLTIVGIGRRMPSFNQEAFVVSIPEPASLALALTSAALLLPRGRRTGSSGGAGNRRPR
jgi:probable HAF family extracellular repeat protein